MDDLTHIGQQIAELVAASQKPRALENGKPFVLVPKGVVPHSIEEMLPAPLSHRAQMTTASLDAFAGYAAHEKAAKHSLCFVRDEIIERSLRARLYLHYGTDEHPEWRAEHRADLTIGENEEGKQVRAFVGTYAQRDLAETLEDWAEFLTFEASDGSPIENRNAIKAIRGLKIEAKGSYESEAGDLTATRTSLEEIEAKARGNLVMPTRFVFACQPYPELSMFYFKYRIAISTDKDSKTPFRVYAVRHEATYEAITRAFRDAVANMLGASTPGVPVLTGWV